MIKYLGSKRTLVPLLTAVIGAVPRVRSVFDLFSGTSRVGHALKARGLRVVANDHNAYAHALASCYVAADRERYEREARLLLAEFSRLPGRPGYFCETFCERARYFQPRNGARVDAIREAIAHKSLEPLLEAVLLVALMEAADRVDSTCGVQMAYLKNWAPRAHRDLELRLPDLLPASPHGPCEALRGDACAQIRGRSADVIYLDPPYNQHSYLGNYHVWESLITWDKPEVYGVACKRVDCKERQSPFNSRRRAKEALFGIIRDADARVLVVSFNNEGFLERGELESMLAERGPVAVIATDYKRYVGAQIGIYNPQGARVGEVSHLRNLEFLYIVELQPTGVDWAGFAEQQRCLPGRPERPPRQRRSAAATASGEANGASHT
ncbi:MAG: DNA adenine methylase [Nannocystis sp.]|nr:DNA adenine methylase [Nannocystis sp.]